MKGVTILGMLYILLGVYFLIVIGISAWGHRGQSSESYLIADRNRAWWQIGFSKYAGSVGAGWLITYTGFAYQFGWPLNLVILGAVAGVLLYAIWAVPRIRTVRTAAAYTQGDFVLACTDSPVAQKCLNISTCIMIVLTLLIAAVGSATLLETFGLLCYEVALILTMSATVLYMVLSGFKAVVFTDIIQGILLVALVIAIAASIVFANPVSVETLIERRDVTLLGTLILIVFGFVATFADPTRFQLTYAGASNEAVKKGMIFTIAPSIITIVAIYLLASAVYEMNSSLEAAQVFPVAIMEYLPGILVPLGVLLFFIALMSTVDSYLYALATHSTQIFSRQKFTTAYIQKMILLYGVVITIIAWLYRDIVDIAVLSGAMLIIIAIPILYLISGGRDGVRFVMLLVGGYAGALVGILTFGLSPDSGVFVLIGFALAAVVPKRMLDR